MGQIRTLVVDDSDFARELIVAILSTDREITIVGQAKNGQEAVEKVRDLKPDIVTMDIEMPVMNGLEAIEHIMAANAVPILVVTTRSDANTAYAAISKGALDLVVKPDVNLEGAREFIQKIKLLSKIKVITHINGKRAIRETKVIKPPVFSGTTSDRVVAIASSTGGPEALSVVLSGLPETFPCPIVIAQHNSDGFIPGLVEWLKRVSKMKVKVAQELETIVPGTAYVSPSEKHMEITAGKKIAFKDRHPSDIYRPSCDMLLSSVALAYKAKGIGIILTGMGSDGARGMKQIREWGGTTIAQDEKTCIVFGMPKVAIESGCIDKIVPLDEMSGKIISLVAGSAVYNI
ncbi:MAG: chemotaxis-specific protein-glutamate methyltransferase CheB [Desulfobacterales bacterium]|nr:chemotaxis-specific protein-glutamate methyltransferase CheB [Desulfobacterales bacterium]